MNNHIRHLYAYIGLLCIGHHNLNLHGMASIPVEIQEKICSFVYDHDTLHALLWTCKLFRAYVLDSHRIYERMRKFPAHTEPRRDDPSYKKYREICRTYHTTKSFFNNCGNAYILDSVNCENVESKSPKNSHVLFYMQLVDADKIQWGYAQFHNYTQSPYFNNAGNPCIFRIARTFDEADDDKHVAEYVLRLPPVESEDKLLQVHRRDYYVDLGDKQPPVPLSILYGRFRNLLRAVAHAPRKSETKNRIVCALGDIPLNGKPLSKTPTLQQHIFTVFTWLRANPEKRYQAIRAHLIPLTAQELLPWAICAAQCGYNCMYQNCVELFWSKKNLQTNIHIDDPIGHEHVLGASCNDRAFARRCSIDEPQQLHNYLNNLMNKQNENGSSSDSEEVVGYYSHIYDVENNY